MIAFENDIFPRQIAARPAAAQATADKPKAAPPVAAKGAVMASARQAGVSPAGGSQAGLFQRVFEAEVRSLRPRPGTTAAPAAQMTAKPAAAGDGGFQPVFETDVLPPLSGPQNQTSSTSTKGAAVGKNGEVKLWDNGGFGFSDILDIINPLQHLPIIATIYRAETGDQIGAIPRILGAMLFGGGLIGAVVGAATAAINLAVKQETGKDIGAHIYTAIFGEGGRNAKTTTIAAKSAPPAAAKPATSVAAKRQTPPALPGAKPAVPPASAKPKSAPAPASKAGPPRGGVRISGKALPRTSLSVASAKAVSNQFRRSAWYRKNQDTLAAQARELVRSKAAAAARTAKRAGAGGNGPGTKPATGRPDMLRLFSTKGVAGKTGAASVKSKSATGGPAPIPKAAIAHQMSKAMAKYEHMLKSRIAAGTKTNQLR